MAGLRWDGDLRVCMGDIFGVGYRIIEQFIKKAVDKNEYLFHKYLGHIKS
ncbi:MAG: hypothetical protein K9J13_11825 [Saprospiraceae bacterium]|nr:hypothetical protein [Saprospiraceae bacterium]